MEIKATDQVIHRKPDLQTGNNVITYGQVLRIEGSSAFVHFPTEGIRKTVQVKDLELVSSRKPGVSSVGYATHQRVGYEPYQKK